MPNKNKLEPDLNGQGPLYKQVEQALLQCLAEGEWGPGDCLPSEPQLARRFGVGIYTIRAGIAELAASNILLRKQGKGTFVTRHNRLRQRYQFSHIYDADGRHYLPERELIALRKGIATPQEHALLALPGDEKAAVIRYTMQCFDAGVKDRSTLSTLEVTVPARLFARLTAQGLRNHRENLYALYQDECEVNVIRIEERIHAAKAGHAEAKLLGLRHGSPVLRVERISYTFRDTPVEWRVRAFNAARYHFRTAEGGI